MDTYVYVQASDGTPLMPTRRFNHVQKLLKCGKARVVEHVPFVIRLKYNGPKNTQPLFGGTDPGRDNIGSAVVDGKGTVVYKDHVRTRNREIAKLMSERRTHRQASRKGERLARKRLARRLGTTSKKLLERTLPGCGKPVKVKDIINTEARFNNRKRPAGWITPSVRQLIQTHVNMIRRIRKFLPVDTWTLEVNKFAFMRLDDGSVVGTDFQNGRLRGYKDEDDYIFHLQDGKCLCCGKERIDHYHHIVPRSRGGSDRWYNIAGLCKRCHGMVHCGEISLSAEGKRRRYAGISVLNQAVPFIAEELGELMPHFDTCTGKDTYDIRELFGIAKDHDNDAVCIAAYGAPTSEVKDSVHTCEVEQFRRHDRALIKSQRERTYCMEDPATGKLKAVAKNRKPRFEQSGPSLADLGLTRQEISRLTVKKSMRYYNAAGRLMPGAEFFCNGGRYTITAERVRRVINGYGEGKKATSGTGGSFSFYELGAPIFNGDVLNEEIGVEEIRKYVYFTETKRPIEPYKLDEPYYMGTQMDLAYYFYYEKDSITSLNRDFLHTVKTKAEGYVIYANLCTLSNSELEKWHITFKKIPRDISRL